MSAIIDDELVEMVATAIVTLGLNEDGRPVTPDAIARSALAVAVPAIVEKCATHAEAALVEAVGFDEEPDSLFCRGMLYGAGLAKHALRALTKEPQP